MMEGRRPRISSMGRVWHQLREVLVQGQQPLSLPHLNQQHLGGRGAARTFMSS